MSDTWGYENSDASELGNTNYNDGPKALREAYAAQKKILDEMKSELTTLREERQKEKLSTVFETLGVPGAQNVYSGPADAEAAKRWVETMRGVFGGNAQGNTPQTVADSAPVIPVGDQERYQRMTEAGAAGSPMSGMDAAGAAIGDASSVNDLLAAFQRINHQGS